MQIFQQLAGYSLGSADMVRRAISKKKAQQIEAERTAFIYGDEARGIQGCIRNGIPEETAKAIYDEIYDFANYAFNKAHAVCYAIVAYQTAYFKCHYPREYMAALLTSVLDSSTKVAEYIGECREMGIALLPPDVNESLSDFTVSEGGIRFGLVGVKGVGRGLIDALVRQREAGGVFRSFQDFCERMYDQELNRRALENLIRCGAFDSLGAKRAQLVAVMNPVMDGIAAARKRNLEGQFDLFGGAAEDSGAASEVPLPALQEFSKAELMAMERETTGLYLTGHPMDEYRELVRRSGAASIGAIQADFASEEGAKQFSDGQNVLLAGIVTSVKTKTTRNNTLMAYVGLEDDSGDIEMLVFSRTLGESGSYLQEGTAILAEGRISVRDEKPPQLMCNTVRPLNAQALAAAAQGGHRPAPAAREPFAPRRESRPGVMEGKSKIYLRLPGKDHPAVEQIRKMLIMFPGEGQLVLYFTDSGKRYGIPCLIHTSLVRELVEMLGEENVVVK